MSPTIATRPDVEPRIDAVDWAGVSSHLDGYGWAMLSALLTAEECEALAGLYGDDSRFRSRIVMAQHGFGVVWRDPDGFREYMAASNEALGGVMKAVGIAQ